MSSSQLIRLGGLATILAVVFGVILEIVYFFAFPDSVALSVLSVSDTWFVVHLLYIIVQLILLVGLIGIYARQAEKAGVLGLIAFLITFFGSALFFAFEWSETFIWPVFAQIAPHFMDHPDANVLQALNASQTIHELLGNVGFILFGVASLRAGVLPRGAAVLLIIGSVAGIVSSVVVEVPFVGVLSALGLLWMGYGVWSRPAATAEPLAPMTASGLASARPAIDSTGD
jgi:hypothetical protein